MMGFEITGHASYDKHGKDIVCSAVSAVAQTALLGIIKVAGVDARYEINDGFLQCRLPEIESSEKRIMCTAILETMYAGLSDIRECYKKYIAIMEEEV